MSNHSDRIIGIEVVRFVSALAVLVWHYQQFFYFSDQPVGYVREEQPLYSILNLFFSLGYFGVQIFWCVSGFIFFWKYYDAIPENRITGKKFFILRFSRLYPLHLFTLLLVAALQYIYFVLNDIYFVYQYNDFRHFALQLTFAGSWGMEDGYSFNGPIWSVSVEILVYFIFFATLLCTGKSPLVTISIFLISFVAILADASTQLVDCLAFFYMGGISALVLRYANKNKQMRLLVYTSLWVCLVLPTVVYGVGIQINHKFNLLFLLLYMPWILILSAQKVRINHYIEVRMEALGNLTYSSYLIHFPLELTIVLFYQLIGEEIPVYSIIFFLSYIFCTLFISRGIFLHMELPAQRYIRANFLSRKD